MSTSIKASINNNHMTFPSLSKMVIMTLGSWY